MLIATSALSLAIALLLRQRRTIAGALALAAAMVAIAEWALAAGLEAAAVPLTAKIAFSKLEYVGSGSSAVLFLLFSLRYTRNTAGMTRPRLVALWSLPLVSVPLVATNEFHQMVWTSFSVGPLGSNTVLYHHGPAFFAILIWIYIYLLAGSFRLIVTSFRSSAAQRRQSAAILVAVSFPWISGILYAVGANPFPGLNLIPISLALTGAVLAVAIAPLRLFDLVPVARDRLIEGMSDGVLVVDEHHRVIDVNPSARAMFALPPGAVGDDLEAVLADWPEVVAGFRADGEIHLEITLAASPLLHVDVRIAPLGKRHGTPAGYLLVVRDISKRYLAETSLQRANDQLQHQIGEIERLHAKLQEQAIRDTLTGLYNRRHLDDTLPRILDRASGDGTPVAVLMLDIDHFKQVNDRHGHRAGDALLSALGALLAGRSRPVDIACRYGGEEFVLVLPGTPLEAAVARAEEMLAAFRSIDLPDVACGTPPTLSAGVAVFPRHAITQDALLHAADDAMYRAKEEGRNRVCSAPG